MKIILEMLSYPFLVRALVVGVLVRAIIARSNSPSWA